MASFTPKAFLRTVPNELLKLHFERRGELRDFAWNELTLSASDPLYDAWCALPEAARLDTEGVFRAVADLATRHGLAVLAVEARARGIDLAAVLPAHASPWHRALHMSVHHPDVFAAAREALRIERLHRRHVRTRTGFARQIPDTSRAKCDELRDAVVAYFRRALGMPDLHCVVHSYRVGERFRYVAYPEDLCRSFLEYARGELGPRTRRPVVEVVFTYDPVAGAVEIYARGNRRRHEDLAQLFSRVVLGQDLLPESKAPARYRVNVLKRRGISFPTDPADHVREVRVKALRLGVLGGGNVTVDAGPLRARVNLYDVMDNSLRGENLPLANVDVQVATLQMVFAWPEGPRTFTFNVHPDRCNLGEAPEEQAARRCIERSEIVCV